MHRFKKVFLFLLIPLFAFGVAHKFYVSVTNVNYSEKNDAFQITSRIFIDDIEKVLEERYGITTQMATANESEETNDFIAKYFRAKLVFKINGEIKNYNFLGKEYDNDVVVCYLEIPEVNLAAIKTIEIQNELLTDLFEEQQNVVHTKINGKKKSFVLVRENNKGMLNL